MKILHLSTYEAYGGAARAVQRLHRGLLNYNFQSLIMVQVKNSDSDMVILPGGRVIKAFHHFRPHLDAIFLKGNSNNVKPLFSTAWVPTNIPSMISNIDPDIVHLHWICKGFISIEDISRIKKPIVWTLHDSWSFTGGCHIPGDCTRYQINCGKCPVLDSNKEKDLSRKVYKRKQKHYSRVNMSVVAPSKWLAECAEQSPLLKGFPIHVISNGLDTESFSPLGKTQARTIWGLPQNKKLVLFGAVDVDYAPFKGFTLLQEALYQLKSLQEDVDIELVIFGGCEQNKEHEFPFPTNHVGFLHDDISLRTLYAAADVMVVPSIQESFGQTASESLACGTPVVAFGCTGLLDIVDHKVNGYLAKPFSTEDLARGICWVLSASDNIQEELSQSSRNKAVREFSINKMVDAYINVYESSLHPELL